jgi:hypothetical protein
MSPNVLQINVGRGFPRKTSCEVLLFNMSTESGNAIRALEFGRYIPVKSPGSRSQISARGELREENIFNFTTSLNFV